MEWNKQLSQYRYRLFFYEDIHNQSNLSFMCEKVIWNFQLKLKVLLQCLLKAYMKSDMNIKSAVVYPTVWLFCIATIEGHVKYQINISN